MSEPSQKASARVFSLVMRLLAGAQYGECTHCVCHRKFLIAFEGAHAATSVMEDVEDE